MEVENRDDEVPADGGDAPDTEDGGGDDATPVAEDDAESAVFFN